MFKLCKVLTLFAVGQPGSDALKLRLARNQGEAEATLTSCGAMLAWIGYKEGLFGHAATAAATGVTLSTALPAAAAVAVVSGGCESSKHHRPQTHAVNNWYDELFRRDDVDQTCSM